MAKHEGNAITARQVAAWFTSSFRRGPWPDQTACERVAADLESQRKALAAKPTRTSTPKTNLARRAAIDLRAALPERSRFWASATPLPPIRGSSDGEPAEIPGGKLVTDAKRALGALQAALEDAMPYLDFPPLAITKHRHKSEHVTIFHIAVAAARALHGAGRKTLGIEPEAPLVDFIVQAIEGMGQTAPPHATIATALSRIPAMDWVKQRMAIRPQTKNHG